MGLQFARPPVDDDELHAAVIALWGVVIPRQQVCPDHVAPFTAFADAYFRRNSLDPGGLRDLALWHGSRGLSGKSYLLAVLGLTEAVFLGCDVNLLGGSFEQSKNIHSHMRRSWDYRNAPVQMVAADGATEVTLTNKAIIRPLTASQKTVRGPHPPCLLCDEIDEMDLAILDAALGQPLPQYNWLGEEIAPYAVMCSTWQNPEGTFTEVMRRAEANRIPVYAWCYRETSNPIDGWLSQATIDGKKAMIPAEMWRTEYDLGEPSIGNRAFDTDAVAATFCLPFAPIRQKVAKDFEEYTFEAPLKHGSYVAGADWGREQDYTVIMVGRTDVTPHRLVYFMRVNRRPYPQMIGFFNTAINTYSAAAVHDATGLGNVVNDYVDIRARKFLMVGEKRSNMLSEYVSAIENHRWEFPNIKSAHLEMKYTRVGDLYQRTLDYHLPDTVCAGGLMHFLAQRAGGAATPVVVARDDTPSQLQAAFAHPLSSERSELRPLSAQEAGEISFLVT